MSEMRTNTSLGCFEENGQYYGGFILVDWRDYYQPCSIAASVARSDHYQSR